MTTIIKRTASFVLAALFLIGCFGCSLFYTEHKITKDGFSITVDENFYESEYINFTYYYESQRALMGVLKEDFGILQSIGMDENTTLAEYAEVIASGSESDNQSEILSYDNGQYLYLTYEGTVSGKTYFYVTTMHKGPDAFWMCSFACDMKNREIYENRFLSWASTIEL